MAEEEEVDPWGLVADVQGVNGDVAEEDLAGIEAELQDFGELERQAAEEDVLAGGVDEAPAVVEESEVALLEQQAALAAEEEEDNEEDEDGRSTQVQCGRGCKKPRHEARRRGPQARDVRAWGGAQSTQGHGKPPRSARSEEAQGALTKNL